MENPESEVFLECDHGQTISRCCSINFNPYCDYGDGEIDIIPEDWSADDAGYDSEEEWYEAKKNRVFLIYGE